MKNKVLDNFKCIVSLVLLLMVSIMFSAQTLHADDSVVADSSNMTASIVSPNDFVTEDNRGSDLSDSVESNDLDISVVIPGENVSVVMNSAQPFSLSDTSQPPAQPPTETPAQPPVQPADEPKPTSPVQPPVTPLTGWQEINGDRYFYSSTGELVKGWLNIDGQSFYLDDETGILQTGWLTYNDKLYYLQSDGHMTVNDWVLDNEHWYYFQEDGTALTGDWLEYKDNWYYFDAESRMLTSDWLEYKDNWYYFNPTGTMRKESWLEHNDNWYYFNPSGTMRKSAWLKYNDDWYYLNDSGTMRRAGWLEYENNWYYINASGTMKKDGWLEYQNKWYFLKPSGAMLSADWVFYKDKWYYLNANGVMHHGWLDYNHKWYYLDLKSGAAHTGYSYIDKKTYFFHLKNAYMEAKAQPWFIDGGMLYLANGKKVKVGNKAILVSITDQRMWGYDGGKYFSTYVTTGARGMDTPKGVYSVLFKARNRTLRGPGYASFVRYWMLFAQGGFGIHDSSWRSVYGSPNYRNNGSHGCVNTPPSRVGQFYNTFPVGTVVYVY